MGIFARSDAPLNRLRTAGYLMILFPDLKEGEADAMLTDLLRKGELEPETNGDGDDVGEAWVISFNSWARFESRTFWKENEARKAQLEEIKNLIEQQTKMIEELIRAQSGGLNFSKPPAFAKAVRIHNRFFL